MIDWNKVNELRDEIGQDDFGEIVECFLEEVEAELSGLAGKPVDQLEASMHFLKGSALNLGFEAFAELCKSGETDAAAGNGALIDLTQVTDCYEASKSAFLSAL